jgi:hypothetical protein
MFDQWYSARGDSMDHQAISVLDSLPSIRTGAQRDPGTIAACSHWANEGGGRQSLVGKADSSI